MKSNENILRLREYLEQIKSFRKSNKPKGYYYSGIEHFVLDNGKGYEPNPDIKPYKLMSLKQCFRNAFIMMDRYGLEYVEGFATTGIIPLEHAWNIDDKGRVIDVTWRYTDGYKPLAYMGVTFDKELIYKTILSKKTYGIIEDWKNHFPLLKEKFKNV